MALAGQCPGHHQARLQTLVKPLSVTQFLGMCRGEVTLSPQGLWVRYPAGPALVPHRLRLAQPATPHSHVYLSQSCTFWPQRFVNYMSLTTPHLTASPPPGSPPLSQPRCYKKHSFKACYPCHSLLNWHGPATPLPTWRWPELATNSPDPWWLCSRTPLR